VVLVQSVLDYGFGIKQVNNLVNLLGQCIANGHNVKVLGHLEQEMLRIRPEDKSFGFLCPVTEDRYKVYDKSIPLRRV
jgi:hypothetical protein